MLSSALRMLRSSDDGDSIIKAFIQLLTPGIYDLLLDSVDRFVNIIRSPDATVTPYIIWNKTMKEQLRKTIQVLLLLLVPVYMIWFLILPVLHL